MRTIILTAALVLSACSGTWGERGATIGYATSTALIACDVAGTVWISDGGSYDRRSASGYQLAEQNPMLGKEPPPALLIGLGVAEAVGGYALLRSRAPTWLKGLVFGSVTAVEAVVVAHNARWVGACGVARTHGSFGP